LTTEKLRLPARKPDDPTILLPTAAIARKFGCDGSQ
jgi:hypothetical protein